jgi:hypothetical protein
MWHFFVLLISGTVALGQTFEVKDRHHITVVTISEVKMFEHSSKLDQNVPLFTGVVKNLSGGPLNVAITGVIHRTDGSVESFPVGLTLDLPPGMSTVDEYGLPNVIANACTISNPCFLATDRSYPISYSFSRPWFGEESFQRVDFSFPDDWQSPEDRRIAAEAQARKDAARRKIVAAERKRKLAEQERSQADLDARIAKERAEQETQEAQERRKVRTACSAIYRDTADKKLRDLTVREDQQVRACQALGLYPPQ